MSLKIEPITIQVVPDLELLRDIVITAAEGGISYWALIRKYQWRESVVQTRDRLATNNETADPEALENLRQPLPFPVLRIEYENPDDNDPETLTCVVSPECVCKGLQLVMTPGTVGPDSNAFTSAFAALMNDDAGAIDSDAADAIIQLGIFGKIVFG